MHGPEAQWSCSWISFIWLLRWGRLSILLWEWWETQGLLAAGATPSISWSVRAMILLFYTPWSSLCSPRCSGSSHSRLTRPENVIGGPVSLHPKTTTQQKILVPCSLKRACWGPLYCSWALTATLFGQCSIVNHHFPWGPLGFGRLPDVPETFGTSPVLVLAHWRLVCVRNHEIRLRQKYS